jgi:hypothetical protein
MSRAKLAASWCFIAFTTRLGRGEYPKLPRREKRVVGRLCAKKNVNGGPARSFFLALGWSLLFTLGDREHLFYEPWESRLQFSEHPIDCLLFLAAAQ